MTTFTNADSDSEPTRGAPSAFVAESRVGFTPLAQGTYFLATGLWPILHRRSFEAVAGTKVDGWLMKTFGALVASVGYALMVGAVEAPRSRTLRALGIGSATALALADGIYATKGRIPRVYFADMLVEAAIVGSWLLEESAHRHAEGDVIADAGR